MLGPNPFVGLRWRDVLASSRKIGLQAAKQPALLLEQEAILARELISVLAGQSELDIGKGDKRFADPAWQTNPFYRRLLQGYVAWGQALSGFVDKSSMDADNKARARFAMSMVTEALAPTNSLAGNPAALKKVVDRGGASLLSGLRNMLSDMVENRGMPAQVDKQAFEVGRNIGLSAGAVVFRNDVLELIQYAPTTPQVHVRPQLIVPPQINKFYVFDIAPGRSIVQYMLDSGFQTFVVSWRNPTAVQRDWDMDTYVTALLEAIDAVRQITGSDDVNLHGACSGAMTMAALLGYLAAKDKPVVHAATLMVAVLGQCADSQLCLFLTPKAVAAAKKRTASKGVLEGREMARVFAWLRPNDLVWNYWVNNYLMGNRPPAFDILYWNNDTTRLPARFHGQLLDIFADGLLHRPGGLEVLGTPVDLAQVTCDKYVLAGTTDHITPWKGVYETARAFGGKTEFVLSSSGHIQSLINPPGNPKARFHVRSDLPETADDWLAGASAMSDSWWEHWREWLAARSGAMRPAPKSLGSRRLRPGAPAPGKYVVEA
ncbi:alpha/beta fold hydrolase [Comamonadaceae bacterium BS-T2-15]|uniref:Alpha/beta fold hydrolase n=2 Tax=Scleromatobacter humisilvae TaxID=2897159 RepID=A0A9X2C4B1_9BURK|nr:alpha/beta fold hydrolase [Scleromatobacter humisilvae]MCK9689764.1 alpha/beta fold hydrolase [Scleromatobacter humisilvae]